MMPSATTSSSCPPTVPNSASTETPFHERIQQLFSCCYVFFEWAV